MANAGLSSDLGGVEKTSGTALAARQGRAPGGYAEHVPLLGISA